eukprot:6804266-Prymnesium_polylepis.1
MVRATKLPLQRATKLDCRSATTLLLGFSSLLCLLGASRPDGDAPDGIVHPGPRLHNANRSRQRPQRRRPLPRALPAPRQRRICQPAPQ